MHERSGGVTLDSEEALEDFTREETTRVLSAVVGHEVDNEVVRSRRNHARKGCREVVRVVEDGPASHIVGLGGSIVQCVRLSELI